MKLSQQHVFRILLLADTHLGLDFSLRPRIERRRRGEDFLANFRAALRPALHGQVDAMVHGGDLFDRSRVPEALVQIALAPLLEVAASGLPVFLVPGNHERSQIPLQLWRTHPYLHIFDSPSTFVISKNTCTLSFSGFPYTRNIRDRFRTRLKESGLPQSQADVRLLCIHQAVEGAQVGPADFTFRTGSDVIRGQDLPGECAAVLSGHIHRAQILQRDLAGRRLPAPVVYPGSVERTAFAEQNEQKGYQILQVTGGGKQGGCLRAVQFQPLPARPMVTLEFDLDALPQEKWSQSLQAQIQALHPQSVVRIRLQGQITSQAWKVFAAANLRALAPPTMNITLSARSETPTESRSPYAGRAGYQDRNPSQVSDNR